jgi:hypothetical protein
VALSASQPAASLPPELFLPEAPVAAQPQPQRPAPELKILDARPHFPLEEAGGRGAIEPRHSPAGRRRWGRGLLLAAAGLAIAVALGLNEWSVARLEILQSRELPALPLPPTQPIGEAAAPVTAPPPVFVPAAR